MNKTGTDQRYVIDSCGWIEFFLDSHKGAQYADLIEKEEDLTIFCPTIVLYEVYKRIKSIAGEEEALKAIVFIRSISEIVPMTDTIALSAADLSLSEGLHMADSLIYASTLTSKAILITGDNGLKGKKDVLFIE